MKRATGDGVSRSHILDDRSADLMQGIDAGGDLSSPGGTLGASGRRILS